MSQKYFNSIDAAQQYQLSLMKQVKQIPTQVVKENVIVTKKEKKMKQEQDEEAIKNFFVQIKEDFLEKGKDAMPRKKVIKKLKKYIEETYKNSDLLF